MQPGSNVSTERTATPVSVKPTKPLLVAGRVPLAFIGLALAALVPAILAPALKPDLLFLPHYHPWVVGLAHLWIPGFLLSACIGATYQIAVVLLETAPPTDSAAGWTHLVLHAVGLVLLILGFLLGRFPVVAIGGACIAAGVVLFARFVFAAFRRSTRRDVVSCSLPLSAGWLVVTVFAGVMMAVNRRWPFLPWPTLALLRTHAHLGLVGFFVTLLQGVAFQLVPMFTGASFTRRPIAVAGLVASQAGVAALALGLGFSSRALEETGAALVIFALVGSGVSLASTLHTRKRREIEPAIQAFILGGGLLVLAAVAGVGIGWTGEGDAVGLRFAMAYGVLAVEGALALLISSMLCKIVPFIVWLRVYSKPRPSGPPPPSIAALGSRRLEGAWLAGHLGSLVLIVGGIAGGQPIAVTAGAWLLVGAMAALLANLARAFRHLLRPT